MMVTMISIVGLAFLILQRAYQLLALLIIILGIIGLIQVAATRDDAFTVIDRKKQNWLLLTGGAAATGLLGMFSSAFPLWIIGAVIVGVYWQDVRPAIKDVLDNASGAW